MLHRVAASLLLLAVIASSEDDLKLPNTEERIIAAGYPGETHRIITEDDYVLTAFRIPHGRNSASTNPQPLILQHGILCSSDCWVLSEDCLGFILADAGFDVWLTNSRGNSYSRGHLHYTPKDKEFWDFSFHEIGYYDIPGQIDHILKETGAKSVIYVGHSQGTVASFVFGATRPEYAEKVKAISAMAPIAYINQPKGAIKDLSKISRWLIKVANILRLNYVLDRSIFLTIGDRLVCTINPEICNAFIEFIAGLDSTHFDKSLLPYLADICPTGASIKQLVHFDQLIYNGGRFTWFDYGEKDNIQKYNSTKPPEYDLSAIKIPTLLYYGSNDNIASVSNVKRIYRELGNVLDIQEIQTYNHVDFMWATDGRPLVYNHMIEVLKKLGSDESYPRKFKDNVDFI